VEESFIDGKLLTIQMLVAGGWFRDKKYRGWQWRTSRPFQPRLPGSVVGEASMDWPGGSDKLPRPLTFSNLGQKSPFRTWHLAFGARPESRLTLS